MTHINCKMVAHSDAEGVFNEVQKGRLLRFGEALKIDGCRVIVEEIDE